MKKTIALFALLASVSSAQAQDWSVGVLGGLSVNDTKGSSSEFTYGAYVGNKLSSEFGLGLYYSRVSPTNASSNIIALEGNYFFSDIKGLYAGIRAGVTISTTSSYTAGPITVAGTSNTEFLLGAQVGYDYNFSNEISAGLNVNWNYLLDPKSSAFQFVVPVKFYF